MIRTRIEDTGLLEQLSAGVVLTGGAVLMEGMTEFAEEILGMPVRMGTPVGVKGITGLVAGPQFATGVGLVLYGANALHDARGRGGLKKKEAIIAIPPMSERQRRQTGRFLDWIKAAF